jgi:CBS domain containing-hemolysin-like protein
VTLEDLLEEVVGEIRDELDEPEDEPRLVSLGPDIYRADARLDLDEFFGTLGIDVDTDMFAFETVGGLVFHLAGAVPEEGDEVTFDRLRLRVETLEANRIRAVSVRVAPPPT